VSILLASSMARRSLERNRPDRIEPVRLDLRLRIEPADESLPGGAERDDRAIDPLRRNLLRSLLGASDTRRRPVATRCRPMLLFVW
jgi:hypothetical protein